MTELLTTTDVAALLKVSEDYVRDRAADGTLPSRRLPGRPGGRPGPLRFTPDDLARFLTHTPTPQEEP